MKKTFFLLCFSVFFPDNTKATLIDPLKEDLRDVLTKKNIDQEKVFKQMKYGLPEISGIKDFLSKNQIQKASMSIKLFGLSYFSAFKYISLSGFIDINNIYIQQTNLLTISMQKKNLFLSGFFLQCGADVDNGGLKGMSALCEASKSGFLTGVQLLVEKAKADVNKQSKFPDKHHFATLTPIHFATVFHQTEVIDYFLKKNVDINTKNSDKDTPLISLFQYEESLILDDSFFNTLRFLLDRGAEINAVDKQGCSILNIFCEERIEDRKTIDPNNRIEELLQILYENNMDFNLRDYNEVAPIQHFCFKNFTEDDYENRHIELLHKFGASIDRVYIKDMPILYKAAEYKKITTVQTLLNIGANPNEICENGKSVVENILDLLFINKKNISEDEYIDIYEIAGILDIIFNNTDQKNMQLFETFKNFLKSKTYKKAYRIYKKVYGKFE